MNNLEELPCRKFLIGQLSFESRVKRLERAWGFGKIQFQRIWVQGVTVQILNEDGSSFIIDDGSGCLYVNASRVKGFNGKELKLGSYWMAIGSLGIFHHTEPSMFAHKLADLSDEPNRETLWMLEVVDVHRKFYL